MNPNPLLLSNVFSPQPHSPHGMCSPTNNPLIDSEATQVLEEEPLMSFEKRKMYFFILLFI
jgi:hypothetical protein